MNPLRLIQRRQRFPLIVASTLLAFATGCATTEPRRMDYFAELGTIAFSSDGKQVAVGRKVFNTVYFFDAANLQLIRTLPGNQESADRDAKAGRVLAFSPAREWAAMAMNDGSLVVREVESGKETLHSRTLKGVVVAAFSPNGQYLVAAGSANDAVLWSLPDAREIGILSGHAGPIRSLAFSSDSLLIASGSDDRTVRIWTAATQKQVGLLEGHEYPVHSVAFSPDTSMLAAYAGEVRMWNLANGKALTKLLPNVDTSAWEGIVVIASLLSSASSMSLGGGPVGAPPVGISTTPTGRLNPIGRAVFGRFPTVFSPDGKFLAVMRLNLSLSADFEVALIDLASQQPSVHLPCKGSPPCGGMAFSPDGKLIAMSMMGEVHLRDVSTGKEVASYVGPFPLQAEQGLGNTRAASERTQEVVQPTDARPANEQIRQSARPKSRPSDDPFPDPDNPITHGW